jgi:hypothetical protein
MEHSVTLQVLTLDALSIIHKVLHGPFITQHSVTLQVLTLDALSFTIGQPCLATPPRLLL